MSGPTAVSVSQCRVGDFVEVKNSVIGDGTKISHLTYVGDSDVGQRVNFGCGTVTTNYDGVKKYRCTIEDGAFIGCNTNLVAPVTVGAGSYIAAGATITKVVPADALAGGQGQAGEQGGVGQTAAEAVRAGALMLLRLIDPTDRNQEHSEHRKRAFKQ